MASSDTYRRRSFRETDDRSIRHRLLRKLCNRCKWSRRYTCKLLRRVECPSPGLDQDGPRFPESEMFVDYSFHSLPSCQCSVLFTIARMLPSGSLNHAALIFPETWTSPSSLVSGMSSCSHLS